MTDSEFTNWLNKNNMFVSYPKWKFLFKGWGLYILPAFNYRLFPKFYFFKNKYFIEGGIDFAGYLFEIQRNKNEKVSKS